MARNIPEIKLYRLKKLAPGKLTAAQKRKIAATCNCTPEYVEMVISPDYQSIDYNMYIAIAHEIGNHQYIAKYGRKEVTNA